MLSYTISNKLTRGKNQRVPQNLYNPKNGQTLEQGWALGNLPYRYQCEMLDLLFIKYICEYKVINLYQQKVINISKMWRYYCYMVTSLP